MKCRHAATAVIFFNYQLWLHMERQCQPLHQHLRQKRISYLTPLTISAEYTTLLLHSLLLSAT